MRGPLAGEHHHILDSGGSRPLARSGHLFLLAAREEEARIRPRSMDKTHRVEQQVESLIRLECAGVEDDRNIWP